MQMDGSLSEIKSQSFRIKQFVNATKSQRQRNRDKVSNSWQPAVTHNQWFFFAS